MYTLFEALHSHVLTKSTIFIYWICPYSIFKFVEGSLCTFGLKIIQFTIQSRCCIKKSYNHKPYSRFLKKVYESSYNAFSIIFHHIQGKAQKNPLKSYLGLTPNLVAILVIAKMHNLHDFFKFHLHQTQMPSQFQLRIIICHHCPQCNHITTIAIVAFTRVPFEFMSLPKK
jgi:hypothetical protein